MTDREKPTIGFWAAVVTAVFTPLVIYVGAYLVLVEPLDHDIDLVIGAGDIPASYAWPGSIRTFQSSPVLIRVFAPLNELDRKLRPGKWYCPFPDEL